MIFSYKKVVSFYVILLIYLNLKSQSLTLTTGDFISNSVGSLSYSIGELGIIYTDNGNVKIAEGVQQPFEFFNLKSLFISNSSVLCYPNPTNGLLNIQYNENVSKLINADLFDVSGKLVIQQNSTTNSIQMDLSNLSSGIYTLILKSNNETINTYKISKI